MTDDFISDVMLANNEHLLNEIAENKRLHASLDDSYREIKRLQDENAALIAEQERLRAENEDWKPTHLAKVQECERLTKRWDAYRIAHESVAKDNERLEADNERLRAALLEISKLPDPHGTATRVALHALEGKSSF